MTRSRLDRFRSALARLEAARAFAGALTEEEESEFVTELDALWYALTPAEMDEFDGGRRMVHLSNPERLAWLQGPMPGTTWRWTPLALLPWDVAEGFRILGSDFLNIAGLWSGQWYVCTGYEVASKVPFTSWPEEGTSP